MHGQPPEDRAGPETLREAAGYGITATFISPLRCFIC